MTATQRGAFGSRGVAGPVRCSSLSRLEQAHAVMLADDWRVLVV
jgi:hypothetical protein